MAWGSLKSRLFSTKKSLEIKLKLLGSEHPLVADSMQNIGVLYDNKENSAAATEMYTKAYRIYLKVLGPDHPQTQKSKPRVVNWNRI